MHILHLSITINLAVLRSIMKKIINTVSLFSGCGGSDLALGRLGYNIVWANDINASACETYSDNVGSVIECGDIRDFKKFPSADFLVGCYPCQGFTQGGRRQSEDLINYLYQEFDRVLRKLMPKAFVVENVNGMAFGENKKLLENQICRYRLAGYRVQWGVLNAADHGVAQSRKRLFIVGVRSDMKFDYAFPEAVKEKKTQQDVLKGFPEWPEGEFNNDPFHWYYLSRNRRREWNEPSPCIVGNWRHIPLHPMSPPLEKIGADKWIFTTNGPARRLAFKECAALQGFPKSFTWKRGTVKDRFQMIGNAVPPPLFESVVSNLKNLW
jgi:DNA (cytosine-5)-methyltransferase 1